ncbi:MAG: hypothetical protein A2033_03855 [Bacteroidetes bacterium GWA2_31_9]|nr:MAG: hypothetical protein A2033_03855 [Bacteroidetes bacterium GWA2_31_9]
MIDLNFIINRFRNIIFSPSTEWDIIKSEKHDIQKILTTYLIPIIITIGIADLLGGLIFQSFYSLTFRMLSTIITMIIPFSSILLSSYFISLLSPSFGAKSDLTSSIKLVTYSYSIQLLLSILINLLPFFSALGILGLYFIFIIWQGVVPLMEVAEEKKVSFVILSVLIIIIISLLISFVFSLLLTPFMVTTIEI